MLKDAIGETSLGHVLVAANNVKFNRLAERVVRFVEAPRLGSRPASSQ